MRCRSSRDMPHALRHHGGAVPIGARYDEMKFRRAQIISPAMAFRATQPAAQAAQS